jgi:LuxR family maltose regulon positive regulatory protein
VPKAAYTPLLRTKITLPPARTHLVARRRLLDRLHEGLVRPLTVVAAPAGFGKTTLVVNWLHELASSAAVAWLSLDEDDAETIHFLYYLVAALQAVEPAVGRAPISLLGSLGMPAPKDLVTLLLNEIGESEQRIVLALDDYHLIGNPEVDAAVEFLVERMPEALRLVLVTREQPDLPLARWRALGRVNEIGVDDLRFSVDESALFLRDTMGLELDGESVRALGDRTEGWIAGLQMAALSRQQPIRVNRAEDMEQRATPFSGEHRYVIDYLADEVLRRQTNDVRSFLTQTGVLERLSAPLCDAVTGRTDSKMMLPRLEQANMFLLPLDDSRHWYRYHQLFADFLRSRLEPTEQQRLQQKASAWHEDNGFGAEAIRYALAAKDVPATIRLFRALVEDALARGDMPTLLAWLDALPDSTVRAHSDLAGYKSWLLYLRGLTYEAQEYPPPPDPADVSADMSASQRGMLYAFHSYLALNWGDPKDAVEPAKRALEQLGSTGSFFRVFAQSLLGQAQALCGDRGAAIETLNEVVVLGRKLGNHLMTLDALGHLTPLMLARGDLREAIVRCKDAASNYVDPGGEPLPVAGFVYVALGILYYESNDLEAARRYLETGIGLCQQLGMIYPTMMGQRALARLQFAIGDREAAWNTLAEARDIAERPESPRRKRSVAVLTAELQLREGNASEASRTLAAAHELKGTTTEHESLTFARLLIAQHHPSLAEAQLSKLEAAAIADKCDGSLASIRVVQALCKRAQGHQSAALRDLETAVSLAASRGYRRTFLDEGMGLSAMLAQVRHVAPEFVSSLIDALPHEAATMVPALPEPLSKSEREILRLLNVGATNQEIADKLGTTVGTTKWHLNQIFGKLQVRNRTGAIAKARQLKLL